MYDGTKQLKEEDFVESKEIMLKIFRLKMDQYTSL